MTEEQKLELRKKASEARKINWAQKKAQLDAYEQLLKEGKAEIIQKLDYIKIERPQSAASGEEKNDDTDPLLLPKKRQRNTQQQSVVTEEQKKINFAQKLQRNAQRKREAWAKARDTQSAKDKARLYSLKSNLHFSGDTTNDATAAQGAISAFPNKALHGIEIVGFDGCAEVSNCSGGLHQEEQSSTKKMMKRTSTNVYYHNLFNEDIAVEPFLQNKNTTTDTVPVLIDLTDEFFDPPSTTVMVDLATDDDTTPELVDLTDDACVPTSTTAALLPTLEDIFHENDADNLEILTGTPYAHITRKDLLTLKPRTCKTTKS